jgi:hypothetical protein
LVAGACFTLNLRSILAQIETVAGADFALKLRKGAMGEAHLLPMIGILSQLIHALA